MLPLAFEIEFFCTEKPLIVSRNHLFSVGLRADGSSAFGLHFLMRRVSLPMLLTALLFFNALLESSAADGRRRHHLRLLLVPQDELVGAGHVLVS